jgi:hypothetical protein
MLLGPEDDGSTADAALRTLFAACGIGQRPALREVWEATRMEQLRCTVHFEATPRFGSSAAGRYGPTTTSGPRARSSTGSTRWRA